MDMTYSASGTSALTSPRATEGITRKQANHKGIHQRAERCRQIAAIILHLLLQIADAER
jgi:hypothetical protein